MSSQGGAFRDRPHGRPSQPLQNASQQEQTHESNAAPSESLPEIRIPSFFTKSVPNGDTDWLVSTGATHHLCRNLAIMTDVRREPGLLITSFGSPSKFQFRGTVKLMPKGTTSGLELLLTDVVYLEGAVCNVFSPAALSTNLDDMTGNFDTDHAFVIKANVGGSQSIVARATDREGHLLLDVERVIEPSQSLNDCTHGATSRSEASTLPTEARTRDKGQERVESVEKWVEWHTRLGHMNILAVRDTLKDLGLHCSNMPSSSDLDCDVCVATKKTRYPAFDNRTTHAFDIVVCGMIGPTREASFGGHRYLATIQDVHTQYLWVLPLVKQDDIAGAVLDWLESIKIAQGQYPRVFRNAKSRVLTSSVLSSILRIRDITQQVTQDESAEENPLAKRASRSLIGTIRPMLLESKTSLKYWAEAAKHAAWLQNRAFSPSVKGIPYTLLYKTKPILAHVKPFGTRITVWPQGKAPSLPNSGGVTALIVGMGDLSAAAYRYVIPDSNFEVGATKNVSFLPPVLVPAWSMQQHYSLIHLFDDDDDEHGYYQYDPSLVNLSQC